MREPSSASPSGDRFIPLAGAFNFRDLGGYPTADGRRTAWGKLFRSDSLHVLNESDVEVLRKLRVASVIDLRAPMELEIDGHWPLTERSVSYHHLPVLRILGGGPPTVHLEQAGDELGDRYLWYLEEGAESLVSALHLLSELSSLPAVFHCTAGKDRTGVLAALILLALGVDGETVVADYELTAARMPLIIERLRHHPVHGPSISDTPPGRFQAQASSMRAFIERLEALHGGARNWALKAGVRPDTFEHLEALLLEPIPYRDAI